MLKYRVSRFEPRPRVREVSARFFFKKNILFPLLSFSYAQRPVCLYNQLREMILYMRNMQKKNHHTTEESSHQTTTSTKKKTKKHLTKTKQLNAC